MGLLVSGMSLNTKKLRLLTSAAELGSMIKYDAQWIGTTTAFRGPDAMAKVLGVSITLDGDTAQAFQYSRNKLKKAIEALGPRRSRLGTKVTGLARLAHMSILYVSQHVSFSPDRRQRSTNSAHRSRGNINMLAL